MYINLLFDQHAIPHKNSTLFSNQLFKLVWIVQHVAAKMFIEFLFSQYLAFSLSNHHVSQLCTTRESKTHFSPATKSCVRWSRRYNLWYCRTTIVTTSAFSRSADFLLNSQLTLVVARQSPLRVSRRARETRDGVATLWANASTRSPCPPMFICIFKHKTWVRLSRDLH